MPKSSKTFAAKVQSEKSPQALPEPISTTDLYTAVLDEILKTEMPWGGTLKERVFDESGTIRDDFQDAHVSMRGLASLDALRVVLRPEFKAPNPIYTSEALAGEILSSMKKSPEDTLYVHTRNVIAGKIEDSIDRALNKFAEAHNITLPKIERSGGLNPFV